MCIYTEDISKISGKCNGNMSSSVCDNGIKVEVGECSLVVVCSGRNKTRCLRTITCPGLPSQVDDHDWFRNIISNLENQ